MPNSPASVADHQGAQIGLGQPCGALDVRDVEPQFARDADRDAGDALDALELGAELVVVDHACKAGHPAFQRLAAILVVEELRVGEPGADDSGVAGNDRLGIVGLEVGHQQKAVDQVTLRILQRKVLLVLLHRQDQALLRHLQVLRLEARGVHGRPLDQRGDFIEQRVGCHHGCAKRFGRAGELRLDAAPSLLEGRDHPAFLDHLARIGVGRADHQFAPAHEAMAERLGARRQAEHADRDHLVAMHGHQPMGRTDELHGRVAVGQLVAHHLRDRQAGQRLVQCRLQGGVQRPAGRHAVQEDRLGLAVALDLQCVRAFDGAERDPRQVAAPHRFEFLHESLRPVARRIARNRERHQLLAEWLVGRTRGHLRDVHRQPARRAVGGDAAVGGEELAAVQARLDAGRERLRQRLERLRRQFLGLQFDQQRSDGRHAATFCAPSAAIGKPSRSRDSK